MDGIPAEGIRVGVISDTHDLLQPEVLEVLRKCKMILHAGYVTRRESLSLLEAIAPVRAVRGNCDRDWDDPLPKCLDFDLYGYRVCMAHKKKRLPDDLEPYDLVITGHTHEYKCEESVSKHTGRRTLYLNPGSCGPARAGQPVTLAILTLTDAGITAARLDIPDGPDGNRGTDPGDIRRAVDIVIRETKKGRKVEIIAADHNLDPELTEKIARLYVTHPGVTADGIMNKLGL